MADWHQAGHFFRGGIRCDCGRYWADIRNTQRSEIDQPGIAHAGTLTEGEYISIERRRGLEEKALTAATAIAAGHAVEAKPEPEPADQLGLCMIGWWAPELRDDPYYPGDDAILSGYFDEPAVMPVKFTWGDITVTVVQDDQGDEEMVPF